MLFLLLIQLVRSRGRFAISLVPLWRDSFKPLGLNNSATGRTFLPDPILFDSLREKELNLNKIFV